MSDIQVTALTIYPVKSMKGIELDRATLTPNGLEHDRRFMVVNENSRFVTQRELHRLALVHTRLVADGVELSLEGHGSVTVPFSSTEGEPISTEVWGTPCETLDQGEEISRWLTSALQSDIALKLVRMAPGFIRPQALPAELGKENPTVFADAAPVLVAGESSLEELNRELEKRELSPVPMNRFRPNIVVSGLEPFAEHHIAGLKTANYGLKLCHPCERCVVTTINQDTAEKNPDGQPFKTLREINPVPGRKPAPAFGQNAVLENGVQQTIALGDRLSVN